MVDSLGSRQITNTDGKIDELHRSPDGRYIAYLKIVEFVESPGLWEEGEEVPKEPVHHLVIQNLESQEILREIPPPRDIFIHLDKWLTKHRVLFVTTNGYAVNDFYMYNVSKDSLHTVPYGYGKE